LKLNTEEGAKLTALSVGQKPHIDPEELPLISVLINCWDFGIE